MTKLDANLSRIVQGVIECGIFHVDFENPTTYTNGMRGPPYANFRDVQGYLQLRDLIVEALVSKLAPRLRGMRGNCAIAGIQSGIIPISTLVADRLGLSHFSVRKEPKQHGINRSIDGGNPAGKICFLLDDVVNNGTSMPKACKALEEAGANVICCGSIFTYKKDLSVVGRTLPTTDIFSLLTRQDFQGALIEAGILDEVGWDRLLAWRDNPEGWNADYVMGLRSSAD